MVGAALTGAERHEQPAWPGCRCPFRACCPGHFDKVAADEGFRHRRHRQVSEDRRAGRRCARPIAARGFAALRPAHERAGRQAQPLPQRNRQRLAQMRDALEPAHTTGSVNSTSASASTGTNDQRMSSVRSSMRRRRLLLPSITTSTAIDGCDCAKRFSTCGSRRSP